MKYHLITYGCQMNTADSEEMAQPLMRQGIVQTRDPQEADVIIMNTCTVRDQAEHRAWSNLGRLRRWKEEKPHRILIVAGCAASRWGNSIQKKYPYIDAVSPATQIEQFPKLVNEVLRDRWNWEGETRELFSNATPSPLMGEGRDGGGHPPPQSRHGESPAETTPTRGEEASDTSIFGNKDTAYVTIMRGCNYTCSYCIVPQVRGREVYRPLPEILDEIEAKIAQGKREVMLLGQTVNSYYYRASSQLQAASGEQVYDFSDLLQAVNALVGVERIRFISPHPRHMRDRLIRTLAACSKVCRHVHLPLQSGSNRILSRMKRFYTREKYLEIVGKLRAAMPGILITTDIIVGFPGETPADFEATLELLRDVRFDGLFAFRFSPRPGTPAAEEIDDVPATVKEERLQQVLAFNHSQVPCFS